VQTGSKDWMTRLSFGRGRRGGDAEVAAKDIVEVAVVVIDVVEPGTNFGRNLWTKLGRAGSGMKTAGTGRAHVLSGLKKLLNMLGLNSCLVKKPSPTKPNVDKI
jgi:hypothetical protein